MDSPSIYCDEILQNIIGIVVFQSDLKLFLCKTCIRKSSFSGVGFFCLPVEVETLVLNVVPGHLYLTCGICFKMQIVHLTPLPILIQYCWGKAPEICTF